MTAMTHLRNLFLRSLLLPACIALTAAFCARVVGPNHVEGSRVVAGSLTGTAAAAQAVPAKSARSELR